MRQAPCQASAWVIVHIALPQRSAEDSAMTRAARSNTAPVRSTPGPGARDVSGHCSRCSADSGDSRPCRGSSRVPKRSRNAAGGLRPGAGVHPPRKRARRSRGGGRIRCLRRHRRSQAGWRTGDERSASGGTIAFVASARARGSTPWRRWRPRRLGPHGRAPALRRAEPTAPQRGPHPLRSRGWSGRSRGSQQCGDGGRRLAFARSKAQRAARLLGSAGAMLYSAPTAGGACEAARGRTSADRI